MLFYLIILIFCYGTYQLLCYLFMLSSVSMGKIILRLSRIPNKNFIDSVSVALAAEVVGKCKFHLSAEERLVSSLKAKGIYMSGAVFLISKIILFFAGSIIVLPLVFTHKWMFLLAETLWILYMVVGSIHLFSFCSRINFFRKIGCQLLLGAFFITQILVFVSMLT